MGNSFVAIANNSEAMRYNPAGLARANYRIISGGFSEHYWGLNINEASLSFIQKLNQSGSMGFSWYQISSPIFTQFSVSLASSGELLSSPYGRLFLGVKGEMLSLGYNKDEFEGVDPRSDIFAESSSSYSFGADAGLLYEYKNLSWGFTLSNINEPNTAIKSNDPGGILPLRINTGLAYNYRSFLTPSLQVSWDRKFGYVDYSFGLESWLLNDLLGVRAGFEQEQENEEISLGISVVRESNPTLVFDYALSYPRKIKTTTHHLSVSARFPKPKKKDKLPDLTVREISYKPENVMVEESLKCTYVVKNVGEVQASDIPVSVFMVRKGEKIKKKTTRLSLLKKNSSKGLSAYFKAPRGGKYQLIVSVDDTGRKFPEINGTIAESSEKNNRKSVEVKVISTVEGELLADINALTLDEITYIKEEEPFVPLIFFEDGKYEVNPRFNGTLEEIARRIDENRTVELEIKGYVEEDSDPKDALENKLHIKRAKAVKERLVELGAPSERLIVNKEGYDPTARRLTSSRKHLSETDLIYARQENRRVEFSVRFPTEQESRLKLGYKNGNFTSQLKQKVRTFKEEHRDVLQKNPDLSVIVEGVSYTRENFFKPLYKALQKVRAFLLDSRDSVVSRDRTFMLLSKEDGIDERYIQASLSGDAILYKPKVSAIAAKNYKFPPDKSSNKFDINLRTSVKIDSFFFYIKNEKNKIVREIVGGMGSPPASVKWDWKNEQSTLVDPTHQYIGELVVFDKLGRKFQFNSDTINIDVKGKMKKVESYIIVEFAFDELQSSSKYLRGRLADLADKIIKYSQREQERIEVSVLGHTDVIGSTPYNRELSTKRAKKEFRSLNFLLINKLGLKNKKALDDWLERENIELKSEGKGYAQPYKIETKVDGEVQSVLLGDNRLPEGRSLNRRVIFQVKEVKE